MSETEEKQGQANPVGRPRILKSVDVASGLIEIYFKKEPEKPTISGLALHLGFTGRKGLMNYVDRALVDDEEKEFGPLIEKAVSRIEDEHERRLYGQTCTGSIFWLKNRGWTDSHDVTSGGEKLEPKVVSFLDAVDAMKPKDMPPKPETETKTDDSE